MQVTVCIWASDPLPSRAICILLTWRTDHCIELMRQSLLCHMDLTPVPRRWLVNGNMTHADQDQVHTCRAREPFHDWIQEQPMERLRSPV
jgi:hypothetical protein